MTSTHSSLPNPESSEGDHRSKRRRSSSEPVVRNARKSRERWSGRRHKFQSWLVILTATLVVLVGITSLVEVLTGNRIIPELYTILVSIAIVGMVVWGFIRLIEYFTEKRYNSISTKSKTKRRERRMRRKKQLEQ
ncbi:MAG: hypothetical protein ACFCUH_03425 [Flavobacteriales bacterium]